MDKNIVQAVARYIGRKGISGVGVNGKEIYVYLEKRIPLALRKEIRAAAKSVTVKFQFDPHFIYPKKKKSETPVK